ncbi:MAG: EAL domain-containing protein [Rhodospirillales bacterium]|nr:EAL domain-containing protein [Rhodospirillales bacterium]
MLEQWTVDAPPEEREQRLVNPELRRALDPRAGHSTRRRLERDLRAAVSSGGLILYYQPRLQLASGAIVGAEALLRWPHPRHGLISPATFIPISERTDLITGIGGFVLRTACQEAMRWPAAGQRPAPVVSVNVSARQFADRVLLEQLSAALELSGLPPERLELELTESVMLDTDIETDIETLLTLSAIRDLGIGLALDDFGAGYASLSMLKRLPLTTVKLDRSLVRGLPDNREDAAIVQAVITAGHALGLVMGAEGIETEVQRAFLSGIGCDEGQGFLFSHPQPAAALVTRMMLAAGT